MFSLTLRARLTLVVAFIGAVGAVVGWFALNRLEALNHTMRDVVSYRYTMLEMTNQTLELSIENSRLTMQMFLSRDKNGLQHLRAQIPQNSKAIASLVEEISHAVRLPRERALFDVVMARRNPYLDSRKNAEKLFVDGHRDGGGSLPAATVVTPARSATRLEAVTLSPVTFGDLQA